MVGRRNFMVGSVAVAGASVCLPPEVKAWDGQGEGTARILSPDRLVAGEPSTVVVEITAGPGGIPVGGGVWVGIHHAALWNKERGGNSKLQADNPKGSGYISVKGSLEGNFSPKWYHWAPNDTYKRQPGGPPAMDWSGSTPLIFHQCLQAKVKHTPIQPGGKVIVTFGDNELKANAPISVDKDHEFFVGVDSTGNGIFEGIGEYPVIDLVAAQPALLTASAQMVQQVGTSFELCVRAEDKYSNTAASFNGDVVVKDEAGKVLIDSVKLEGGLARIQLQIDGPGPQRLRLDGGRISGRSEPIMVFEEAPAQKVYFGDLHGHTRVSDGCGADADEYFRFGREEANLDVCALTDHWHYAWAANQKAVEDFYEPGKYVTILGEECGTHFDHVNHYFLDTRAAHSEKFPSTYAENNQHVKEMYLDKGVKVITGPHHFTYDRGEDAYPWGGWQPEHARFAEVYSNHGASEYLGNPRALHTMNYNKTMQAGLAQGHRFGVIASTDSHVSHPGRSNWGGQKAGLVAFVAPTLTREDIWDSLWNYRVYALTYDRIYIDFKIEGYVMGDDFVADAKHLLIQYKVVGADDGIEVFLVRNNSNYRVDKGGRGIVNVDFEERVPEGENFYYLRVVQANGEMAWSTPIWIANRV